MTAAREVSVEAALAALKSLIESGMTKAQIADKLGVTWRSVHRWVEGTSTPVSQAQRSALVKLAGKAATKPKPQTDDVDT